MAGWLDVELASAPQLQAGSHYAILMLDRTPPDSFVFGWFATWATPYVGGTAWMLTPAGTWTRLPPPSWSSTFNFLFQTYVRPVQGSPGTRHRDPCILRYPSGVQRTTKISGGAQTLYDRQASLYQVCEGFGAPEHVGFTLTPSMQCALIAAAATYGGPVVNAGVSRGCDAGSIYNAYRSGDWLGAAKSYGCGYFSTIFAGGVGVFAAGAAAETGPGAVAVGVATYRALAASLKLVCGGVFKVAGTALGKKLEANHETHIAIDVIRHGKCITLKRRFGILQWSAVECRKLR